MATYYVDKTTGSDADDGLSEANAWQTIDKAMNTVAAGDKVYVKGGASYFETATIDTAGTRPSPITFEGYTTTPGDGGSVTIDGQSSRASGILDSIAANTNIHYVFKNFIITEHTSHGVSTDCDHIIWKNCQFNTNGGHGYNGRQALFEKCQFNSNGSDGANITTTGAAVFIGCKFFLNTVDGVESGVGLVCAFCEFFSNGGNSISGGGANDAGGLLCVINCTIDGDADDTTTGINANPSFDNELVIVNTIIYDCLTGISANHTNGENHISLNNLLNNNGTDYTAFSTTEGEVTSAPAFVDEATNDYNLQGASPAVGAGFDAAAVEGDNPSISIGAFQAGTADYPSEDDVRDGVTFDNGGQTGNLELPVEADVRSGTQYGTAGTEFTGTMAAGGGDYGDKRGGKQ